MKADLSASVASFSEFFNSVYKGKIDELAQEYPTKRSLYIEYSDLERFDPEIADALQKQPDLVIEAAEQTIREMNVHTTTDEEFSPKVRFVGIPSEKKLIEQLSSKEINELVAFKCVVTKRAELMHRIKIAVFKCQLCEASMQINVGKDFEPPKKCDSCKKIALKQIDEESTFVDIQRGEVQELLERVKGGAPTARIEVVMEDELVNQIIPGDSIVIVGILRLRPPLKTKQKAENIYSRYIDVNSLVSMKRDFEQIEITKDDEKKILELSKKPDLEDILINSIAPFIYGHTEVKRAISLQLFGGTRGKIMQGGMPVRDDIHLLLIGDPGIAKCTSGDSKVVLADGSVQTIKEMVEKAHIENERKNVEDGSYAVSNEKIVSMNLSGKVEKTNATYFWKLESPEYLYEIETSTGRKVRVTSEHPFFVGSNGYILPKKAKEIEIGEFIATPRFLKIEGEKQILPRPKRGKTNSKQVKLPKYLDKDFARLVGYLIGDGYVRRTSSYEISLTNSDEDLINDFGSILKKFSLKTSIRGKIGTDAKIITSFSVELGRILDEMGLTKNSFEKRVPQSIMKSTNDIVKEFIKAYFDSEASIGKEGLTIVSASREVLDYVQILLMRFGIICQIHETYARATNAKNHKPTRYYRMFILGENAVKYAEHISFTSREKVEKLSKIGRKFNTNIDVVPNLKVLLKEIRENLGLSQFDCGVPRTTYQHLERGDRHPSQRTLAKVLETFKKSLNSQSVIFSDKELEIACEKISILETISKSHIFWDKIKSVSKVKAEDEWVYDLQVDQMHNFVANNLFVHNSRFLQSISEIAPKSIYVSGKSVSGAGLTVAAEKDELGDGGWVLKAGALVLASGGIAQIDEFDKIDEEDRATLHEAMETQTISVAKAGIVAKFRTKTAILSAANPKYGRFDTSKNLAEQFEIPPTLLSRFDLIFPIVDVLDEEKDLKLAEHILSSHMGKQRKDVEVIDKEILRKYIAYARRKVFPKLTSGAKDKIKDFYVDLRAKSRESGSVAITPRYLEGLVRLAEAHAKLRLSDTVEDFDAQVGIDLMNFVMRAIMTDKTTGLFDVDVVATGKPKSEREKMQKADTILDIIRELLRNNDSADVEKVIEMAKASEIDESSARRILTDLLRRGIIYEKEYGHVKIVGE